MTAIWAVHVAAFTRLLSQMRRHFDGDLDLLLIMAIVGEGARSQDWHATLFTEARPETEERPTNSQSIAELSGIPRESVRRKLAILERKGWIERDPAGSWHPTRKAARDLEAATRETLVYLDAISAAATAQVRP